jgi:hypothetical protein
MRALVPLLAALAAASCDGGAPPAAIRVAEGGAPSAPAQASAAPVRFEAVDQLELMGSRFEGAPGLVRVAKLDNDDRTFTVLARTQPAAASGAALVEAAAGALQSLLAACAGEIRAVCSGSRDLHLRIHAAEESFRSAGSDSPLGFEAPAAAWANAPEAPAAALERVEVLPATPVGRAALEAWCGEAANRTAAPGFCAQADAMVRPRR